MKVNDFSEKYCLHNSIIDEINHDVDTKELTLHMDFAFWMQNNFVEGTPENGMVNVCFRQVEGYTGITGKIDWFSVNNISLNSDNTITCAILDDYNGKCYEWKFYVSEVEFEDLHIDTNENAESKNI